MGVLEILCIVVGVVIVVASFFVPAGKKSEAEDVSHISEDVIRKYVQKEIEASKFRLDDIVEETITYAIEKAERSMDRLTNEKMLAVNEYSDTVLDEINKNHKEVIFLYDMLNDKHDKLKETVRDASQTANEVKQIVKDVEITAKEAEATVRQTYQVIKLKTSNEEGEKPGAPVMVQEYQHQQEPEEIRRKPESNSENSEFLSINPVRIDANEESILPELTDLPAEDRTDLKQLETRGETEDSEAKPEKEIRNNNERILELHEAGKSLMGIAKELGLGIGEVKLVIDLFEGS